MTEGVQSAAISRQRQGDILHLSALTSTNDTEARRWEGA